MYGKNEAKEKILEKYKSSLEIAENPRISAKIALLESEKTEQNEEKKQTGNNETRQSEEIEKTQESLQKDQQNRSEYLNASGKTDEALKTEMQNLKKFLSDDEAKSVKDW